MKIDRLIGILSILLQQEKVTAPYLAEKFEVSRRTIIRDVEALCKAGIPIVTAQGREGGISIMDGYRVDRTLLTSREMQSILTGLKSLDSVSGSNKYQQLMDKLSVKQGLILAADSHIAIDLSSFYKEALAPKIELILSAAEERRLIGFDYVSPRGEGRRKIEPYVLIFQWSSWYVWGFCLDRKDYRLFKLHRMTRLCETGETFSPRDYPPYDPSPEKVFPAAIQATALFEPSMKWRLMEEYGPESFEEAGNGRLLFTCGFTDVESLFGWLLSFGPTVELLEPEELRPRFRELVRDIIKKYNGDV